MDVRCSFRRILGLIKRERWVIIIIIYDYINCFMAATFNGNTRATIISSYSPINVSEETELVIFYEELSSLVRSIPKHNVLVIGGDMNAQIRKNGNNKYSLHNTTNRNGQHQTDFMIENRLTCLNTIKKGRENNRPTHTRTIVKHR